MPPSVPKTFICCAPRRTQASLDLQQFTSTFRKCPGRIVYPNSDRSGLAHPMTRLRVEHCRMEDRGATMGCGTFFGYRLGYRSIVAGGKCSQCDRDKRPSNESEDRLLRDPTKNQIIMENELKTKSELTGTLYACPMHPEVTGKKGDNCSKCGMHLELATGKAQKRNLHKDANSQEQAHCPTCGKAMEPGKGEAHVHGAASADVKGSADSKSSCCCSTPAKGQAK